MATTEQDKADLARKRGQAATQISDPEQRKTFIASQGEAEKAKGGASDEAYQHLAKEAEDTMATGGANKAVGLPSYKKGTNYVPKTGPAIIHEGEAIIPKDKNKMHTDKMKASLSDEDTPKPKKEIKHIKTRKTKDGKYIHTHEHHRPEHHPDEEHVSNNMDELKKHMEAHMGDAEPAEGDAGAAAAAPAQMTATPSPMPAAAAGPAAQPGM